MTTSHHLGLSGLHHVSLRVADLDRSLALYRDVLGLALTTAFTLDDMRFAWLAVPGGGALELVETQRPSRRGKEDSVQWHFALHTDDLEVALAAVRGGGYEILVVKSLELADELSGRPLSLRVVFFRGPDGEEVELLEDRGR